MSSVVIKGDTSGQITVSAPAVAGTNTLTLPTITGTIGTLNSGTAVASTSGTSIDFTGIPAGVRRITVMFNGVSTNGTSNIQVQLGAGSVTTSGYSASSCAITGVNTTTYTAITSGFPIITSVSAINAHTGNMVFTNISGNNWVCFGVVGNGTGFTGMNQGVLSLGGTLDRVRITTVGGTDTFDAGSINILYE